MDPLKKTYTKMIAKEKVAHRARMLPSVEQPVHRGPLARRNEAFNWSQPAVTGYIGQQGGGGQADELRLGLFRMRRNGCGAIAAYNLLKYTGHFRDIREIASDLEYKGVILRGLFGIRPDEICAYISAVSGEQATLYGLKRVRDYDDLFRDAKAGILTFWNAPGRWSMHSVMLHPLGEGRIRVYNYYTNIMFTEFDSIEEMLTADGRRHLAVSLIVI